jgi:hypothetical protein
MSGGATSAFGAKPAGTTSPFGGAATDGLGGTGTGFGFGTGAGGFGSTQQQVQVSKYHSFYI